MENNNITLNLAADCQLLKATIPTQRVLEINIEAPSAPANPDRPPLNLALVLDRSGSMEGNKLPYAIKAALHAIDLATERDHIAVAAYDDDVTTVSRSLCMTGANKLALKERVSAIRTGGTTNLSGGWFTGAELISSTMQPGTLNRVLLLTDGLANRGIVDQEELVTHAKQLNLRGISTTTIGVGYDFAEHLLEPMALNGGGHFYFVEHPVQIPLFFQNELGEMLSTVARDASLEISFPAGVGVELLGDLPCQASQNCLRVPVGAIASGSLTRFYLQMLTPPGEVGKELDIHVRLTASGEEDQTFSVYGAARFTYGTAQEVEASPVDRDVRGRVATVELATAQTRALKMDREGHRDQAIEVVCQSVARYSSDVSTEKRAEVDQFVAALKEGMSEGDRKVAHHATYAVRASRGM